VRVSHQLVQPIEDRVNDSLGLQRRNEPFAIFLDYVCEDIDNGVEVHPRDHADKLTRVRETFALFCGGVLTAPGTLF